MGAKNSLHLFICPSPSRHTAVTFRLVSKPSICRLLMLHCLWEHGCEPEISCSKLFLVFACLWECGWRLRCTHAMRALTCVSVVVCVPRKLQPCLSYSRRRDRINLGLLHSLYKGGGVLIALSILKQYMVCKAVKSIQEGCNPHLQTAPSDYCFKGFCHLAQLSAREFQTYTISPFPGHLRAIFVSGGS